MYVRHEVAHLMMVQVELVEYITHPAYFLEFLVVFLVFAPGLGEQVLYTLESPEEVKDLFVALHDVFGKDGREGGEVVHSVV